MRAKQFIVDRGEYVFGVDVFPYQLALGFTIRPFLNGFGPAFRLYVGPIKVWGSICKYSKRRPGEGNK